MSEIKAIETIYNGYHFRSRLEARWAVFFDTLGVKYEYEPEGFQLPNGMRYLPDFLIHDVVPRYAQGDYLKDIYVEVKGSPNATDAEKVYYFSQEYPIWTVGNIPDPETYVNSCIEERIHFCHNILNKIGEYGCALCPYDHGTIDHDDCFEFSLGYDFGTLSFHGADSNYGFGSHYKEIEDALLAARQARFEHGETPTTGGYRS